MATPRRHNGEVMFCFGAASRERPTGWSLVLTVAVGLVVLAAGIALLAGLVAFLVALTNSGSFVLWAIEWLLRLAGG